MIGYSSDIEDRPKHGVCEEHGKHLLPVWRQPIVLACVITVSGLIPVSGPGKKGQKGHCWVPGEDNDNEA